MKKKIGVRLFVLPSAVLLSLFVFIATGCKKTKTTDDNILVPVFNKIVVVIGENQHASTVIGHPSAPYINSLAQHGANFSQSYAIEHPSQPNYLDLFGGSNQGITDNNLPATHFKTANLARELLDVGKSFVTYSEDLPSAGFDGVVSGLYARKHNPVANWMGTDTNQVPESLNQPFSAFPTDFSQLPNVSFVVPNECNDGHDNCGPFFDRTKQFDYWVQTNLDAYKQWCTQNNSLLIVTYDEDDFSGDNRVATVFYGSRVMTGAYHERINHYTLLRTIESCMGLSTFSGNAASAKPISNCWKK